MASNHKVKHNQDIPRFIVDGFVFHVNNIKGDSKVLYLRCLEYKRLGCLARAIMPHDGTIENIVIKKSHNHPPDYAAEEKIIFLRELKEYMLKNSNFTTKEVYDTLSVVYPNAAKEMPYEVIQQKMKRWRKLSLS